MSGIPSLHNIVTKKQAFRVEISRDVNFKTRFSNSRIVPEDRARLFSKSHWLIISTTSSEDYEDYWVVNMDDKLGSGTSGEVFPAYQASFKNNALIIDQNSNHLAVKRIERGSFKPLELEDADKAGLCKIYKWKDSQGRPLYQHNDYVYVFMELIYGTDLFMYIESIAGKNFFLTVNLLKITRICRDMVIQVAALHDKGQIHGDIKVQNFQVDPKNPENLRLIDYGNTGNLDNKDRSTRQQPGIASPNTTYFAPEVFDYLDQIVRYYPHKNYTTATDVYMLGIALAKLLSNDECSPVSYPKPVSSLGNRAKGEAIYYRENCFSLDTILPSRYFTGKSIILKTLRPLCITFLSYMTNIKPELRPKMDIVLKFFTSLHQYLMQEQSREKTFLSKPVYSTEQSQALAEIHFIDWCLKKDLKQEEYDFLQFVFKLKELAQFHGIEETVLYETISTIPEKYLAKENFLSIYLLKLFSSPKTSHTQTLKRSKSVGDLMLSSERNNTHPQKPWEYPQTEMYNGPYN